MKICGIVSEFNPFHNGHKLLIDKVKSQYCDAVVCVMSGEFVQRGEYASCDKYTRSKAALNNGADLILSIPFPWSSATAELFARGAVSILNALGCIDYIAFGSEAGDISQLQDLSKILGDISRDDVTALQSESSNLSFAKARQLLAKEIAGESLSKLLSSPNDILAIEYIKAINYFGSSIIPIAVKREYSSHDGAVLSDEISSSSYIRSLSFEGRGTDALRFMPCGSEYYLKEKRQFDKNAFFHFLCGSVLSRTPENLSEISENGGGFEYALYREIMSADDYESLFDALRAKHLTDSKIRRALLFTALGVTKKSLEDLPAFTEVLAFNETGKSILSLIRKECSISVLSKPGNISKSTESAKQQYDFQRKSELIFKRFIM